jgi:2-hydroxychromene-2-carboxylate isomerase
MKPIDFYFDFSSPYGYLASQKIEALAERHGRTVDWHPVLLGVVFKQTGAAPLTEVPVKGPYSKHDFFRSARFHGIDFNMPPVFPIPAQAPSRIVLWAKQRSAPTLDSHAVSLPPGGAQFALGSGPSRERSAADASRLAKALYRAFFVEGRDISKPDVAAEVAGEQGFDAAQARAAVDDPAIKDALRREVEGAMAAGVFGSPFVVVDGEPFWGLDRFDQIERWLRDGGF